MGQQTFGKGSVQTIVPINQRTAVKLTTARYFTPNGRSIQAEGIVPDIAIDRVKVESVDITRLTTVKEANLARHLKRPDEPDAEGMVDVEDVTDPRKRLALTDYELYEALNLLKSLALVDKRFR
jgi:carboxyl-terminal processing protease